MGYSPRGCKELDTTERLHFHFSLSKPCQAVITVITNDYIHYAAAAAAKLLQSCPTLCDPVDCSLPGFSVHGILQARILEWVTTSFSQ